MNGDLTTWLKSANEPDIQGGAVGLVLMSPRWGLGCAGRSVGTWGSRRQAVRCRPVGAWEVAGVWSGPGAHAARLYDVAPLGLGKWRAFGRTSTWGSRRQAVRCRPVGAWEVAGVWSGPGAHAARLYDVAPLGLGKWRAFGWDWGSRRQAVRWGSGGRLGLGPGAHAARLYDVAPLGLGKWRAFGRDLGFTPPGYTMSPRRGSGSGGRLVGTWGSRRQAVRCRPVGAWEVAGVWSGRGAHATRLYGGEVAGVWSGPGAHAARLYDVAPLGLGSGGRLVGTWGSRRQAVRCRPVGAREVAGVWSGPGAHATRLYDIAPSGLGKWRAFGRDVGLTPPGCTMSPRWGLGCGGGLAGTWGLRHQAIRCRPVGAWDVAGVRLGPGAHAARLYDVAPLGLGKCRDFGQDLGLTPPGYTMSPRWGLGCGGRSVGTWGSRRQAVRCRPVRAWDQAGVWSGPGAHAGRLYDVAPWGLGFGALVGTWGSRRQAVRCRPVGAWDLAGVWSGPGLTPPGCTMSPRWGLGCGGRLVGTLGLTPPGCTMSPRWGLGCGGVLVGTWGLRHQAIRCRPVGAWDVAGVWWGPGAYATRLYDVAPLGLGMWRAFGWDLGLTPPGCTMSPREGLGSGGRYGRGLGLTPLIRTYAMSGRFLNAYIARRIVKCTKRTPPRRVA